MATETKTFLKPPPQNFIRVYANQDTTVEIVWIKPGGEVVGVNQVTVGEKFNVETPWGD